MSKNVPPARPALTRPAAVQLLARAGVDPGQQVVVLGRRGYFRDTLGLPGLQERGIYDDAIAVLAPGVFKTFNANTDPSQQEGRKEGLATLQAGVWPMLLGIHGRSRPPHERYQALIQGGVFTVRRDLTEHWPAGAAHPEWGECLGGGLWRGANFCINIHRGGVNTTGSAGCQTIYAPQWMEFIACVRQLMHRLNQQVVRYVLTERGED